jgi:phenylpyruvate tautomerase PptA (4-oxalocrotonate tautomerase family)
MLRAAIGWAAPPAQLWKEHNHMPFISVSTNSALTIGDKQCIAASAGKLISKISGKSEAHLMVKVDDHEYMTFGGKEKPCAFIDLHLYTEASFEDKKDFAEAFQASVAEIIGIPVADVFMTVTEHNEWGSGGAYRSNV